MSCLRFFDLAASRQFYEKVIGLILTAEEGDALYFRGIQHRPPMQREIGRNPDCEPLQLREHSIRVSRCHL
jgi:hypothetical protein